MNHPQRTTEHLLKHNTPPIERSDDTAAHFDVYPTQQAWLTFFDKALLVIGSVALALALVFFIAYNWSDMGKMGKFALVEGALVITIALYVGLCVRRQFFLIRQLLLLIASIITGSLLALFGQTYQTGADTWQLFFVWALLITPWAVIARFPALWLLWLGLLNACLLSYLDVTGFLFNDNVYQGVVEIGVLAVTNFVALTLWLFFIDHKTPSQTTSTKADVDTLSPIATHRQNHTRAGLHWSTYVVGLFSTYAITHLAIFTIFDNRGVTMPLILLSLWGIWCAFMVWRFYRYRVDVLMLTYVSFSIIVVVMCWASRFLLENTNSSGFLVLALLLVGLSSAAVVWLRKAARLSHKPTMTSDIANESVEVNATDKNSETNFANNNDQEDTPWFVQILFGFSGLLASLFFIGFLTLILESTGALDNAMIIGVIGLLLNACGFIAFRYEHQRRSMFLSSLAFMISVAGQLYVVYGLSESGISHPLDVWVFLLLQSALIFIVPSFMYRLIGSLVVFGYVVFLLGYYALPEISLGLLALIAIVSHLQRHRLLQRIPAQWQLASFELIKAVGYASALMLLYISVYFIVDEYRYGFDNSDTLFRYSDYWAQGLLTLASLYAAYLILQRYRIQWHSTVGLITGSAVIVLGIISTYVAGLLATSLVIIIAVANSTRTLFGIGVFALVCYVFWYYYQLNTSLLVKSVSMLVVGLVLLLLRWILVKRYRAHDLSASSAHLQHNASQIDSEEHVS
ncbi:DUF2157 domain-containing protein [Psychrobacter sp. JB385]|uniref:DUF2157 domain-containing protein n=1 Tax=Psychrobacter sp. JB385 TaxID=1434841 RepID=UPI00097F6523|nr:DUF2157 domain-containing protein [Psychrobacter sp. JB385]SJN42089.1 putative membrane protein [Psychrobacter sp. JB385]